MHPFLNHFLVAGKSAWQPEGSSLISSTLWRRLSEMIGQAMAAFSGGRAPPVSMVIILIRELMNRSDQPPVSQMHLSPQLCFNWIQDIKGKYKNRQSQHRFNNYFISDCTAYFGLTASASGIRIYKKIFRKLLCATQKIIKIAISLVCINE